MLSGDRAKTIIKSFSSKRLLVVGDVILDRFVYGTVNRQSPEDQDCPILDFDSEVSMLGGAANVAANARSLGCREVGLLGVTGSDGHSFEIQRLLREAGIIDLLRKTTEPTTTKIRFVNKGKHLLRFDIEAKEISQFQNHDITLTIEHLNHIDAIIVQDYAKGLITAEVLSAVRGKKLPVFVDPKHNHWDKFASFSVVKPNMAEARIATGKPDERNPHVLAKAILSLTKADYAVVTAGKLGMSFASKAEDGWILPKTVQPVDVSGAGDTVIATLALARLSGASMAEAVIIANAAAGIVVSKQGTSTVTEDELLSVFTGV